MSSAVRPILDDAKKTYPSLRKLEAEVAEHVTKHFSDELRLLGEEQRTRLARLGVLRAGWYRIKKMGPLCQYVDLMVVLGSEFDEDPQLRWVHDLASENGRGIAEAMAAIGREAVKYTLAVRGREGEVLTRALLTARKVSFVDANQLDARVGEIGPLLQKIYPQKLSALGDGLEDFVLVAGDQARELGLEGRGGLYTVLTFLLGWKFEQNPRFAWAAEALTPPRSGKLAPAQLNKALYDAAVAELDRELSRRPREAG